MGILADKDVQQILRLLEQVSDEFYFVDFDNPRAMAAQNLLGLSKATSKKYLSGLCAIFTGTIRQQAKNGCIWLIIFINGSTK
ncbi:hypothetical protein OL548_28870 [Lysinibacillus sp. MHQ-1]|nr:hypothetical protein OL548_28870 [Lysinibacillus sp. MHQ-1]